MTTENISGCDFERSHKATTKQESKKYVAHHDTA